MEDPFKKVEQSEEEKRLEGLFLHKVGEKFAIALNLVSEIKSIETGRGMLVVDANGRMHIEKNIINKEKEIQDRIETIQACKTLFRDFLEMVIDGRQKTPSDPVYSLERIKEAHIKSDFDWTDKSLLVAFRDWFFIRPDHGK